MSYPVGLKSIFKSVAGSRACAPCMTSEHANLAMWERCYQPAPDYFSRSARSLTTPFSQTVSVLSCP